MVTEPVSCVAHILDDVEVILSILSNGAVGDIWRCGQTLLHWDYRQMLTSFDGYRMNFIKNYT